MSQLNSVFREGVDVSAQNLLDDLKSACAQVVKGYARTFELCLWQDAFPTELERARS